MTIQEAISKIHAPKGYASILAGLSVGDYSVIPHEKGLGADLEKAKSMAAQAQKQLDECKSDWAYWSILGDLSYWNAIVDIYESAQINDGVVPDVEAPDMSNLVVMDAIGRVERFGKDVLNEAKRLKSLTPNP